MKTILFTFAALTMLASCSPSTPQRSKAISNIYHMQFHAPQGFAIDSLRHSLETIILQGDEGNDSVRANKYNFVINITRPLLEGDTSIVEGL